MVDTLAVLFVERARPRALGAVLPQHPILLRRELAPPLFLAHRDCEFLGRRMISAAEAAQQALCHDARLSDRKCDGTGYRDADAGREEASEAATSQIREGEWPASPRA